MRRVYMVLAWLMAAAVFVQAGSLAFAHAGEDHYVDHGGTVDSAFVAAAQAGQISFVGDLGYAVHGMNGTMVIPLLALLLLVSSFFVRGRAAKLWALLIVGLVALQITLGFAQFDVPYVGWLHGMNALAILLVSVTAALRARRAPVRSGAPETDETEPRDAVEA